MQPVAGSISFYQLNCKVPEWKLGPGKVDFQVTQGGRPLVVSSDESSAGEENGESLTFEYYTTTSGVLSFTSSSYLAYVNECVRMMSYTHPVLHTVFSVLCFVVLIRFIRRLLTSRYVVKGTCVRGG